MEVNKSYLFTKICQVNKDVCNTFPIRFSVANKNPFEIRDYEVGLTKYMGVDMQYLIELDCKDSIIDIIDVAKVENFNKRNKIEKSEMLDCCFNGDEDLVNICLKLSFDGRYRELNESPSNAVHLKDKEGNIIDSEEDKKKIFLAEHLYNWETYERK